MKEEEIKQELEKLEPLLKDLNFLNKKRKLLDVFDLREFLYKDARDACISYDGDCIYDADSYAQIIKLYIRAAKKTDLITVNSSFYDNKKKRAGISFSVNDHLFEGDWAQTSGWVEYEFLDLLEDAKSKMNGQFLFIPPSDDVSMELYVVSEQANIISSSFKRLYEFD